MQGGHRIELEGRGASHQLAAAFGQLGGTARLPLDLEAASAAKAMTRIDGPFGEKSNEHRTGRGVRVRACRNKTAAGSLAGVSLAAEVGRPRKRRGRSRLPRRRRVTARQGNDSSLAGSGSGCRGSRALPLGLSLVSGLTQTWSSDGGARRSESATACVPGDRRLADPGSSNAGTSTPGMFGGLPAAGRLASAAPCRYR